MIGTAATYVLYNDGSGPNDEGGNIYALVVKEHSPDVLDLSIVGVTGILTSVPHREPSDYGPEGGGVTWRNA